ncbi:MAB_1171c family putative transporter [Nonomuraea lactucae]|uniref:MAB_1171c family putative transporter n=1 Tax=Nonomuraea lactucae TaxID=2249762 RepID=UPI000DE38B90|nr:MAB_1171c family putative transporter [Nonomuraea lactucae]
MIENLVYPLCATVLTLLLAGRLRRLRRRRGSAPLWALCGTLFFPVLALWLRAGTNAEHFDRVTGVPNLSVLVLYSCTSAFTACALATTLLWREPAERARRRVRWVLAGYGLVIATMAALFFARPMPGEHPLNFALHHGGQPTVRALAAVWLTSVLIGTVTFGWCCFTWARDGDYADHPWLRRGLRHYGAAGWVLATYTLVRGAAVGASWLGTPDLNTVATTAAAPVVLAGSFFLAAAVMLPVWGPRIQDLRRWAWGWRVFAGLWRLHRALRHVEPALVFVAPGRRLDPHHRVRRMVIELADWRWRLAPMFDPEVEEEATRLGRLADLPGDRLRAAVEAARLKAAAYASHRHPRSRGPHLSEEEQDCGDIQIHAEVAWWTEVARAFRRSPIVTGTAERPFSGRKHARP